jgi:hypothetical protein
MSTRLYRYYTRREEESDLVTIEGIAEMHFCSVAHARDIVQLPGFPLPAPTSTERNRLWVRAEIRDYITRGYLNLRGAIDATSVEVLDKPKWKALTKRSSNEHD